jgi:hypothetical protein
MRPNAAWLLSLRTFFGLADGAPAAGIFIFNDDCQPGGRFARQ